MGHPCQDFLHKGAGWLEEHAFIVTDTGVMLMAEVDKLAGVLEEFEEMNLSATVAFLKGMPPMEGSNGSSSSSSNSTTGSMFPEWAAARHGGKPCVAHSGRT
jgi:hypothetical protein